VRARNTVNILYKNIIDSLVGAVTFYFFGFGLAFGTAEGSEGIAFIGNGDIFLRATHVSDQWHIFFFHWAVVAAVVTIAAGAIAERCRVEAYIVYTVYMTTLVYPIIAHW
jgi:ammonium transporter, Amt family